MQQEMSQMDRRQGDIEETLPREAMGARRLTRSSPVLYVAFFCDNPFELPSRHSLNELTSVTIGRGRARASQRDLAGGSLELRLPDPWASSQHAQLTRSGLNWQIRDRQSKNGVQINGHAVESALLSDGDVIELGHTLLYYREDGGVAPDVREPDFAPIAESAAGAASFMTLSGELAREMSKAWDLAGSDLPLLIQGESGTGKEVLARALAARSERQGPFVGVNCGAIPPQLVESELFGHVKGAFTGAESNHDGLIRSAHGGTLFLDEIGDLELGAQAALLRVLQSEKCVRLDSARWWR